MNQPTESQPTMQELARLVQDQQRRLAELQKRVDAPHSPHRSPFPWLRRPSLMSFALVGLLIVVSGVVSASVPAANGVITGCYTTPNGALRLIDTETGQICSKGERTVGWNQVGPAGPQGSPGAAGPQGLPGAAGPQGGPGAPGISGYEVVKADTVFDTSATKSMFLDCPVGKYVLGGGASIFPSLADPNRNTAPVVLTASNPSPSNRGWFARSSEIVPYAFEWDMTIRVICANVTTTTVSAAAAASEAANDVAVTDPPVAVTEPATTTTDAKTIFLPIVTH